MCNSFWPSPESDHLAAISASSLLDATIDPYRTTLTRIVARRLSTNSAKRTLAELRDPLYADTSALVKLVVNEPESAALVRYLGESNLQLTSNEISEVELLRAVARVDRDLLPEASDLLERMILLPLTRAVRARAARIPPVSVRSLDAIHLATAIEIQAHLRHFMSYDNRFLDAARAAGFDVVSPQPSTAPP